jgi:hypothetical protein
MQLIQILKQIKDFIKEVYKVILIKLKIPVLHIITYKTLINDIKLKNGICHIIATGHSAIASYNAGIVSENDYIIGFNFAGFLPYEYDLYICEDVKIDRRTVVLKELLKKCIKPQTKTIFKNAYSINTVVLAKYYKNANFAIVWDKPIRTNDKNKIINNLFKFPSCFMKQHGSTVITATMIAYHSGFKKIIIHGLDFQGPHIFHNLELQKQIGIVNPIPYYGNYTVKHVTASYQELIWPSLIKELQKKEVEIYSACQDSKFSEYAPVYKLDKNY